MRTLVTGGAGFIGSALVDRLVAEGHEVVVLDNLATESLANLAGAQDSAGDRLEFVEADICDERTESLVEGAAADVVFHLAAQADVRVSVERPVFDAEVNVIGSLRVIDAARRAGARKIVFAASGGTLYGEPHPDVLPVDETHPQAPVSPYGVAKKVVTHYLEAFHAMHGLDYTALALANVYGPRQDPHGEAGVVAIFAGRLLAGEACTIFGSGEQTRDFVYVGDVVDAFVRAIDSGPAALCNVGTGVETSVNDLYAAMASAAGERAEVVFAPARAGEVDRSALDPSLAHALLGWTPSTALSAGVEATIDWFRSR